MALVVLWGCSPVPVKTERNQRNPQPAQAGGAPIAAMGSDNPGINLRCAANRIRNPIEPFHWSFRKTVSPFVNANWEASITPDSIVGTVIDGSGTHAIHAVRSDRTSWNTAVSLLAGPLPASAFALVSNSSAMVRAGRENINGEPAIKYAIDTARAAPGEAALIKNVLGANGFIKGAAWVNSRGCPVKFVLNIEQHNGDGAVEREHDEENITPP